jgi:uncharacterized membrane protein YeaQ/YmgE (transglycosylase-associated protein family)
MWIVVGAIIGRAASFFIGKKEGIVLDVIVGIMGAFVAGFLLTPLLSLNQNPFNFPAMLVAIGGAVILLVILNLFRRRGYNLR